MRRGRRSCACTATTRSPAFPSSSPRTRASRPTRCPQTRSSRATFTEDHELLQREQKDDVSSILPVLAYGTVLVISLGLILLLGWALRRVASLSGEHVEEQGATPEASVPAKISYLLELAAALATAAIGRQLGGRGRGRDGLSRRFHHGGRRGRCHRLHRSRLLGWRRPHGRGALRRRPAGSRGAGLTGRAFFARSARSLRIRAARSARSL